MLTNRIFVGADARIGPVMVRCVIVRRDVGIAPYEILSVAAA